jgi:diadenosine tetraphosphate (Ap4A) HIT family hydrolase
VTSSVDSTASVPAQNACELCREDGGTALYRHEKLRIVEIDDPLYPGFCRVVWHAHVTELTDLTPADRSLLMTVVCKVEQAVRETMAPHKVNLASLGNMTPHLHWHVIPRYTDDAHFPQPVWGQRQRTTADEVVAGRRARLPALRAAIAAHCASIAGSA